MPSRFSYRQDSFQGQDDPLPESSLTYSSYDIILLNSPKADPGGAGTSRLQRPHSGGAGRCSTARGGRQGAASGDKPDLPTMRLGLPAYPAQRHRVEPANGTATNDESGDDLHRVVAMPTTYAIRLEVLAIDGEDFPRAQRFGGGNERCVRQVHRVIGV